MLAAGRALTWEYLRIAWWRILLAVAGMVAFIWLFGIGMITIKEQYAEETILPIYIVLCFQQMLFFFMAVASVDNNFQSFDDGFSRRHFTLPLRASTLVGWAMALRAVSAFLMCMTAFCFFMLISGVRVPCLAPSLFSATVFACAQAVVWAMPAYRIRRLVVFLLVIGGLLVWVSPKFGIGSASHILVPTKFWAEPTLLELTTMAACIAIAYFVSVYGVERNRMGERLAGSSLWNWAIALSDERPSRLPQFASPLAAQHWFEWEPKGYRIPGATAIIFLFIFGVAACAELASEYREPGMWLTLFFIASVAAPLYAAFAAGAMFAPGMEPKKPGMRTFAAVRPLSNSQIARINLRAGALNALATWGIVLLATAAWYLLFCDTTVAYNATTDLLRPFGPSAFLAATSVVLGSVAASWVLLGLGASLCSTGRPWMPMTVVLSVAALGVACGFIKRNQGFSREELLMIGTIALWTVAIICLAGTSFAFWAAFDKKAIDTKKVRTSLFAWLFIAGVIELLCLRQGLRAPSVAVFVFGASALLFAPFATLPLALAWNRHR